MYAIGIGCVPSTTGFCQVTLKLPAEGPELAALLDTAETLAGAFGELTASAPEAPLNSIANTENETTKCLSFIMNSQS